jgi:hypothetical protein
VNAERKQVVSASQLDKWIPEKRRSTEVLNPFLISLLIRRFVLDENE